MKAITLTQPWASLVMFGFKRIETRGVLFTHRGALAMHAAKNATMFDDPLHEPSLWLKINFPRAYSALRTVLTAHEIDELPRGAVLGVVDVVDGERFTDLPFPKCLPFDWEGRYGADEEHFGNFAPGRGGLLLDNRKLFSKPVPARGMNGLWNWDEGDHIKELFT